MSSSDCRQGVLTHTHTCLCSPCTDNSIELASCFEHCACAVLLHATVVSCIGVERSKVMGTVTAYVFGLHLNVS